MGTKRKRLLADRGCPHPRHCFGLWAGTMRAGFAVWRVNTWFGWSLRYQRRHRRVRAENDLVLGNTGIQVYFRVGHQDAQVLANEAFVFSPHDVKSASMRGVRYKSAGEQRQLLAQDIQDLPPRVCYVKHKIEGGLVTLRTVDIAPAEQVLGLDEDEYAEYLANRAIGQRYVVAREKLVADIAKRFQEFEAPSGHARSTT